jgi:sialate O-acetylesterase
MKTNNLSGFLAAIALGLTGATAAETNSAPFVSPIFGDNMVLQRGKANSIWGWSTPGAAVRVEIAGHAAQTQAGPDGRWELKVEPPAPGGPYTLRIEGPQQVELREILVGDVWLCGGQSNMELPLGNARDGQAEIAAANCPEIRLFKVASHPAYSPARTPQGRWKICSPQTVAEDGGFSAAAYFFARKLQSQIHVPIGLVEDCVGGTPAEAWTSAETLRPLKDFDTQLAEIARLKARGGPEYGNFVEHWYDDYDPGQKSGWAAPGFDDSSWKSVQIPGGFGELGVPDQPAVCWFRKEIQLPDPLPPGRAAIALGIVQRMDTTFVNGQRVGASAWVENPRHYALKDGLLKPGKNVVAIRVFKTLPDGGFMSKPEVLCVTLGDGTKVPLAGDWRGKSSVDARPPHPLPLGFENWPVMPTVLYQGMIEPIAPLAITGAIWYQGEANADRARRYQKLLPAMIGDWRKVFAQGDFPFYVVSLPAFMHRQDQPPAAGGWAEMREAQAIAVRSVKNAALAVTVDTGDPDNIHPPDKQIVGERLALCALAGHYGGKNSFAGPAFRSLERLPGALRIHFDHADGGLVAKGGAPGEFAVAGADGKWSWAEAKIDGDTVTLTSPEVSAPQFARYAWQSFPRATLYNGAGLPAVPFRSDPDH